MILIIRQDHDQTHPSRNSRKNISQSFSCDDNVSASPTLALSVSNPTAYGLMLVRKITSWPQRRLP
jgi:hypothetical protein